MQTDWTGMAEYGLASWIAIAVAVGVVLYPVGRILRRMGFSPLLSIVAFFPFVNLLALWIVAFIDWPKRTGTTE